MDSVSSRTDMCARQHASARVGRSVIVAIMVVGCVCALWMGAAADAAPALELSPSGLIAPLRDIGHVRGYSLTPSTTEPYAACPEPTTKRASCFAIAVPPGAFVPGTSEPIPFAGTGEKGGLSPADLQDAYDIPATGGEAGTVAVVVAYQNPTIASDLNVYRQRYGLPPCEKGSGCFRVVNQNGGTELPAQAPKGSWGLEAAIDVEMVSAMCSACHIVLVEASSSSWEDLLAAQSTAATLIGTTVISDSWGFYEDSEESEGDPYFDHPAIPTVVAAGDIGFESFYPASSSKTISVGGTQLLPDPGPRGWKETVWGSSSGGCSPYENKPAWQSDWRCGNRLDNDVAAVGSPSTPTSIYSEYAIASEGHWGFGAGTSASAPLIAGIEARLPAAVRLEGAQAFYRHDLNDVMEGRNGRCEGTYLCTAGVGNDGPTGWGSPDGLMSSPSVFSAQTGEADRFGADTVRLHGFVHPGGVSTTYQFEYGPTTAYGNTLFAGSSSDTLANAAFARPQELERDRLYHYRLAARNASGTTYGDDRTFATMPWSESTVKHPADWSEAGNVPSALSDVACPSASYCMATGNYGTASGTRSALVEAWNGSAWLPQPNLQTPKEAKGPPGASTGVSCTSATNCTAVGSFLNGSGVAVPLAELWNGTAWVAQNAPTIPGAESSSFTKVSCPTINSCMAVGVSRFKVKPLIFEERPIAARWTGTEWLLQSPVAPTGAKYERLTDVSCVSAANCVAVGKLTDPSGEPIALRWNGSEWTSVLLPKSVAPIAVSCIGSGLCVAVGKGSGAATWTGSEWVPSTLASTEQVYQGYANTVPEMLDVSCVSSHRCVAVGTFSGDGGSTSLAEKWNGHQWFVQNSPRHASGSLQGVSCPTETFCHGVGMSLLPGHSASSLFAEHAELPSSGSPLVTTKSPERVTGEGARLVGIVDPHDFDTSYYFEFGLAGGAFEQNTPVQAAGEFRREAKEAISGLKPGTAYKFRIVATNETGTTLGNAVEFSTAKWSPRQPAAVPGALWTAARDVACVSATDCYAAGSYLPSTGAKAALVQHWDGTTWANQSVPAPSGSVWTALADVACTSSVSCIAVGRYETAAKGEATLAESWDGSKWTVMSPPNPAGALSSWLERISCSAADSCTAVGRYETSGKVETTLAERWNGTSWSIQTTANPAGAIWARLAGVSCPSASNCIAVGSYETSSGVRQVLAEAWNGTSWSLQSPVNAAGSEWNSLKGVWCAGKSECLAVGSTRTSGNYRPLSERLLGSTWQLQSTPGPVGGQLLDVSCISMTWCEATGTTGAKEPVAENWRGAEWIAEKASLPETGSVSALEGVSCPTRNCLAVGYAEEAATPSAISEIYLSQSPWVKTEPVSGSSFVGSINPEGSETKYHFDYGTTTAYGSQTAESSAGSGMTTQSVSKSYSGLLPNTLYHVRIVAANAVGTSVGNDVSFKTPPKFDFSFGTSGSGAGQLRNPSDVALDSGGNVWVADSGNNRIAAFDSNGSFIETFGWNVNKTKVESGAPQAQRNLCTAASKDTCQAGLAGSANGQMNDPLGIAVSPEGFIWVADSGNDRVQVFPWTGEFIGSIGASSGALFAEPAGIAVAPNGHIWVTQRLYSCVEEFTGAGGLIREIAGERGGGGPGEFFYPEDVATDSSGHVWVADSGDRRITQLGPNGEFISMFGLSSMTPQGIGVEPGGNLLVSSGLGSSVKEFSPSGESLSSLGGMSLLTPHRIAVGPGGIIYVANTGYSNVGKWG